MNQKNGIGQKDDLLSLDPKYFGPFWDYIQNDEITDVDFNGTDLWITDSQNRRTKIENHGITTDFIEAFSQRVSNQVSKEFNRNENLLEAETKTLRISILHESAAVSGRSVCLRKSLPKVRMTAKSIVESSYMPRPILNLLTNCIMSKMNMVVGGEPGAGKTESAKFFTQFIPDDQRVITIEDSPEWHYHTINPTHDCVEMRVNPQFSYAKAIKTCLRQNPKWIMLSEARSVEAKYLIEAWSTGVNGVTTIHTDDIRKIASRLLNMMGTREDADRLENDIYDFVNVVFLVRRKAMPDGTARRYIDQMGFFYRDEHRQNKVTMLVKNGEMISDWLPPDIAFKLSWMGIEKPFECEVIDSLIGDVFFYTPMTTEAVSLKPEPSALESTATVVEKAMPVIPKAEVKPPSKPKPVRPQAEMAQTSKPKTVRPQKRKPLPLGTLKFAERKGDHS